MGSWLSCGATGEDGAVNLLILFRLCLQLRPTGTCRARSRRPCQQHTSSRPCTHSRPSCSAWPWSSSSGFTPTTLCMACRSRHRRITTGVRTCFFCGAGRADRSVLTSTAGTGGCGPRGGWCGLSPHLGAGTPCRWGTAVRWLPGRSFSAAGCSVGGLVGVTSAPPGQERTCMFHTCWYGCDSPIPLPKYQILARAGCLGKARLSQACGKAHWERRGCSAVPFQQHLLPQGSAELPRPAESCGA